MNLYGWDTEYATTIDVVNKALAKPNGVLSTFSLVEQGLTIEGKFGPWSIVEGGSGYLLHLQTAIASGAISGGDAASVDLSGTSVLLEINLQLLPSTLPDQKKLVFNFKSVGKTGTPSGPGVVTPLRVNDPGKKLSFFQSAVLGAGIAQYLVNEASSISFVFAEINLVTPGTANSWLTPVECDYSYYQTGAGTGYLVILSATTTRDTSGLSRQVDPALVSGSGNGFFAISASMFLEHVVLPVMPKVYSGTNASYFKFVAANAAIQNSKNIKLPGVKSGAITYYPIITGLSIKISGSTIVTTATGSCDMYMGMNMTFSVKSTSASSFNAKNAQLTLAKDKHPVVNHESHIPWYDYLMGAIPDLVMAIVVPIVANGIATGLDSSVKNLSFAKAGPQDVQWPGMKSFEITGGGLNGGFQISGNDMG